LKHFYAVAGLLLVAMAFAQIISVRQESETWDEGIHLTAGYLYWKTGDLRFNSEHPPLGKYLNSLPLLSLDLRLPGGDASDELEYSRRFLYQNAIDARRILFAGRAITIALTALFGVCLVLWTRRYFGSGVALFALALFAFDPNLIAHGRYVTSDLLVAFTIFLACTIWAEYLVSGRTPWLALSGISVGMATGSKFSALILIPIFLALYALNWRGIRPLLAAGAIAALVIVILYAPEARAFLPGARILDPSIEPARHAIHAESLLGRVLLKASNWLALGRNSFFEGLTAVASKNAGGHDAYLLGKQSKTGWWYYFPVVFLVKSPIGLLLGVILSGWVALRSSGIVSKLRSSIRWQVMILPPVIYFAACIASGINLGVRHLLPVYPFLCVLIAASLWSGHRIALAVVTALVMIESCAVFPYYLAFFNAASGGPSQGPRYLVDSNIDWGQDLPRLKAYLDQHGEKSVCLAYFGSALPDHYGIEFAGPPEPGRDCLGAVSVTALMGVYLRDDPYAWLRKHTPAAKIGYSIYVYDLRTMSR
jgi:hypothetical protein